jgi:hypothetical protein
VGRAPPLGAWFWNGPQRSHVFHVLPGFVQFLAARWHPDRSAHCAAAVCGNNDERGAGHVYTEADWTQTATGGQACGQAGVERAASTLGAPARWLPTPTLPSCIADTWLPYNRGKLEAERRAWELHGAQGGAPRWRLVFILPSFVVGPPASLDIPAEGIAFARDLLDGKFWPMFPRSAFAFIGGRRAARGAAASRCCAPLGDRGRPREVLAARALPPNAPWRCAPPALTADVDDLAAAHVLAMVVGWGSGRRARVAVRCGVCGRGRAGGALGSPKTGRRRFASMINLQSQVALAAAPAFHHSWHTSRDAPAAPPSPPPPTITPTHTP